MGQTVQGNVVIKRLRTGHTLALGLKRSGAELYQTVDAQGNPLPSWTEGGSHPIITPEGRSLTANKKAKLSDWTWKYIGNALTFDSNGYSTNSGLVKKFKVDKTSGKLEIIGNLASESNTDNDTLTFTAKVTVDGVSAVMSKDIEVVITQGGASSYYGNLSSENVILNASTPTTVIKHSLIFGGKDMTYGGSTDGYSLKWYKGVRDAAHAITDFNPAAVTRSDVDGTTLFVADFIVNGSVVYTDGIIITDEADEFYVRAQVSDSLGDTDVTATGQLRTIGKPEVVPPVAKCTWEAYLYKLEASDDVAGDLDFANGTGEMTDISTRNTSTEKTQCTVKVKPTDSAETNLMAVFLATFEI